MRLQLRDMVKSRNNLLENETGELFRRIEGRQQFVNKCCLLRSRVCGL